ncbi:hypothetical protein [Nocardia sp. NPDC003963]
MLVHTVGYWDHDYSHLSVDSLTRHLEHALFDLIGKVADDPGFGDLLADIYRRWSETIAEHPDPVAALLREAEELGGIPRGIEVFDEASGDIDLVSLLVVVNMLRQGHLRSQGGP